MSADDIREVAGGGDMNWQLWVKHALRSCSFLHCLNMSCILFIFCTSVSLFINEVGRVAACYCAQERGEGLAEHLVVLVFGGVGFVGWEDGIFNSGWGRRGHGLSRSGEMEYCMYGSRTLLICTSEAGFDCLNSCNASSVKTSSLLTHCFSKSG